MCNFKRHTFCSSWLASGHLATLKTTSADALPNTQPALIIVTHPYADGCVHRNFNPIYGIRPEVWQYS